jgi:hypothetical protein
MPVLSSTAAAAVYPGCLQARGRIPSHDRSKTLGYDKTWAADRTALLPPNRNQGDPASSTIVQHDRL